MKNNFIKIDPGFLLYLACVILLIPLKLAIAWVFAVTIHELSHMVALKLCRVKVRSVRLGASGVIMDTEPMENWKELICTAAGPLGGFALLSAARWLPCTAVLACAHSFFNLLPIFPLDGGRALRCVLIRLCGIGLGERLSAGVGSFTVAVISIFVIYLSWKLQFPALAMCFAGAILIRRCHRKFPCKRTQQIVQYDK